MFDNLIHASLLQLSIFFLVFHSIICPYLDVFGRYARTCISENPGCFFIATNRDSTGHMTSAQEWPGLSLRNLSNFWTISLVSVLFATNCVCRSWNYGCRSKLLSAERAYCCWKAFRLFDGLPLEKVCKMYIRDVPFSHCQKSISFSL
jgi:hypothetical protein